MPVKQVIRHAWVTTSLELGVTSSDSKSGNESNEPVVDANTNQQNGNENEQYVSVPPKKLFNVVKAGWDVVGVV
jgi:hypothetical protein